MNLDVRLSLAREILKIRTDLARRAERDFMQAVNAVREAEKDIEELEKMVAEMGDQNQ